MISGKLSLFAALITTLLCCSCAPRQAVSITPKGLALAGQRTVCGAGPLHRTFAIAAVRAQVQLGQNLRTETWTYGGTLPGPVIEACEGDTVTIRMSNNDTDPAMGTDHGFDSHAFQMDTMRFAAVAPGETLELTGEVSVPGVFMYHCASASATDWHIKTGMYGAMVVYPRKRLPEAREILVVQSAIYGDPDQSRNIVQTTDRANANNPFLMMFNGTVAHTPVAVKVGDRVRVYFVNVGPGDSAVHVMGSILERFYIGGNSRNVVYDVQTGSVPPGGGAAFEFTPPKGQSMLVDHNNLRFLAYGMEIEFDAE